MFKRTAFFLMGFTLINLNNVSHAGQCMNHLQPDGSFGPQFFRSSPFPASWSPQDVQEYQYLGNWTCHFDKMKGVQRQQAVKAFLARSAEIARRHPEELEIWIWRGEKALEIEDVQAGWQAAQNLKRFFPEPYSISLAGLDTGSVEDAGKSLLNELKDAGWATPTYEAAKANNEKDKLEYEKSTSVSERLLDKMEEDEIIHRVECDLRIREVSVDRDLWDSLNPDIKTQVGIAAMTYCKESENRPTSAERSLEYQLSNIRKGLLFPGPNLTKAELDSSTNGMKEGVRKEAELRNSPIKFEDHDTLKVFTLFDGKQFLPVSH